jgi:hypothetical protein
MVSILILGFVLNVLSNSEHLTISQSWEQFAELVAAPQFCSIYFSFLFPKNLEGVWLRRTFLHGYTITANR